MATYKNLRKVLNLPTLSESPSSGVNGEMYFNTTDSALYIYDGAWKKVTQSAIVTHPILGDNYGILGGGYNANAGSTVIQKYSHTSDGDSVDTTANLTVAKQGGGSAQTLAKGYAVGGSQGSSTVINSIDVYTFATSSTNATTMGVTTPSVSGNMAYNEGNSGYSETHLYYHGYRTGTYNNGYPTGGNKRNNKTSFASTSGSMTYVGTITSFSYGGTGGHSDTHGYADGGIHYSGTSSSYPNAISRYAFASDGNASAYATVGSSHTIYRSGVADSREKHYMSAGQSGGSYLSSFSHASGGTATSTNNLVNARSKISCTISSTHIYFASGASFFSDNNEKIALASDTTAASAVGAILVQSSNTSQDYDMFQFQH